MSSIFAPLGALKDKHLAAPRLVLRHARWTVWALSWLIAAAFVASAGKDVNWDALNYHFYAGFSALTDRSAQDFMAAGLQGYMNPYAYVPFYLMISAGWPSLAIGLALASFQLLAVWLVFELALLLMPGRPPVATRVGVGVLAMALALLDPVLLLELGNTFIDLNTAVPVLAGWCLVISRIQPPVPAAAQPDGPGRALVLAGLLLGAAASLKLSNVLYAVALAPAVLCLPGQWPRRVRWLALFGLAGIAGGLLTGGPWGWKNWQQFGNPLFPFFNGVFRSPEFITEPVRHMRFVPDDLQQALIRPFRMMLPVGRIHTEPAAPDLRYAALALMLAAAMARAVLAGRGQRVAATAERPHDEDPGARRLWVATSCFGIAWALWLQSSGNSRYFLPMGCVAAALLAVWCHRLFRHAGRTGIVVALAAAGLQWHLVQSSAVVRWAPSAWAGPWFETVIPEPLKREPALYVTTAPLSASFLAPLLHPAAGMMNVSGNYLLGPGVPGGASAADRLARAGELRTLVQVGQMRQDGQPLMPSPDLVNGQLLRFGLRVDLGDCEVIRLRGGLPPVLVEQPGVQAGPIDRQMFWQSCRLVRDSTGLARYESDRQDVDRVFDRIEAACPNLFSPRGTLSERNGDSWRRMYMNTDISLWTSPAGLKFYNAFVGGDPVNIGRFEDWLAAPQPIDCRRSYAPAFGLFDLRQ